jgi:hypothetical protein
LRQRSRALREESRRLRANFLEVFHEFAYRTHARWRRERRVVGKAAHRAHGPNPRFVVSSLTAAAFAGQALSEQA